MAPQEPEITDRQQLAITYILAGDSDTDVATRLGVDRRTIYNWRQSRVFVDELELQRMAFRSAVNDKVLSLMPEVCSVLTSCLKQTKNPQAALAAASVLLRELMKRSDQWSQPRRQNRVA